MEGGSGGGREKGEGGGGGVRVVFLLFVIDPAGPHYVASSSVMCLLYIGQNEGHWGKGGKGWRAD